MDKTNIRKGAKNVVDYLDYCNQLKELVDSRKNNSNVHRKQINNLDEINKPITKKFFVLKLVPIKFVKSV